MSLKLEPCGRDDARRVCVAASGTIDRATLPELRKLAHQRLPRGAVILLDSEGGNHVASLAIGDLIRRYGFDTAVAAYDEASGQWRPASCASACAYVFIGGVDRSVPEGSRVGVHQLRFVTQAQDGGASEAQTLVAQTGAYLTRMGAKIDVLLLASQTEPETMHWLSRDELVSLQLVNSPAW
jgi:hypothetical protein